MAMNLSKGQSINLTKGNEGLKKVMIGLGWDLNNYKGSADFDLDATAFLLDGNNRCLGEEYVVFYNHLTSCNGAIVHTGDNTTGGTDGDDEQLIIDLQSMPQSVQKIAFAITIHEAENRNQTFGQVSNSYVRLENQESGSELVRYNLGEEFSFETSVIACELNREGSEWKFHAAGQGHQGGLAGLCVNYGLSV